MAIRECWSRVIVIGYYTDNLKAETYSAIHYLRKSFVFELWFPSRIVSAHLYVAMTSLQMERVINKNYRILLRNFIVGINGLIADIKKNNVLNINPTLRNLKYAFLFPFNIDNVMMLIFTIICYKRKLERVGCSLNDNESFPL